MNKWMKVTTVVVVVGAGWGGWWLLSPLWTNTVVHDALPISTAVADKADDLSAIMPQKTGENLGEHPPVIPDPFSIKTTPDLPKNESDLHKKEPSTTEDTKIKSDATLLPATKKANEKKTHSPSTDQPVASTTGKKAITPTKTHSTVSSSISAPPLREVIETTIEVQDMPYEKPTSSTKKNTTPPVVSPSPVMPVPLPTSAEQKAASAIITETRQTWTGTFVNGVRNYKTSGKAKVFTVDGTRYIRLENFETTNGPDLFVYLAKEGGKTSEGIEVSVLKGNIGDQNYVLDSAIDITVYNTVVIWCRAFDRDFGYAKLQ
jgi:hypothetical protein